MSLSDKRKGTVFNGKTKEVYENPYYPEKDVKKFIEELKGDIDKCGFKKLTNTFLKEIINKLAGPKLNGKVFSMEIKVDKSLKDNEFKLKQEIN